MKHTMVFSKTVTDNTGLSIELPVVLVEQNGTVTVLWQLHHYLIKNKSMSDSWKYKIAQIVGLLLDYIDANQNCFPNAIRFFESFTDAIYCGTINEEGYDPSGLYWLPKHTKNANNLLYNLSVFSDWMFREYGTKQLNPWKDATKYEERLNWMALANKSHNCFLGHLDSMDEMSDTAKNARNTKRRRISPGYRSATKAFPEERIHDLLWIGFKNSSKNDNLDLLHKYNWRNIAITILLHGGGVRESEPFHLWIQDVLPDPYDPRLALVRIYDPVDGAAPKDLRMPSGKVLPNREAYLKVKYGLKPRNKISGLKHAGWKSPKMSDSDQNYMQVYWFPKAWGYLFMQVWKMYMAQRIHEKIPNTHPYLFVSFRGQYKGDMYTKGSFRQSHQKAVEKIGLTSAKLLGTTEHGHRHAYGQRATIAKLERPVIQAGMHHKSDDSQDVYTEPTIELVTRALNEASVALESGQQLPMAADIESWFKEDRNKQRFYMKRGR